MTIEDESRDAHARLNDAQTIIARIEDAGGAGDPTSGDACYQAYLSAKTALQALCIHYNQEFSEDTPMEDLFGMLSPSYLRVPSEVQRAQALAQYATPRATAGNNCTEAVALAQNVVSWVEVVMAAGKPFIIG